MARNGPVTRDPTEKQTSREHRSVGSAIKANCFICRKYLKRDGTVDYRNTSWQCKECRMPLCKLPRIDKQIGRTETCLTEHQESDHPIIGCTGSYCPSITFPKDLQVNLSPRRSNRLSRSQNTICEKLNQVHFTSTIAYGINVWHRSTYNKFDINGSMEIEGKWLFGKRRSRAT